MRMKKESNFDNFWKFAINPSIHKALEELDPIFIKDCGFIQKEEKSYKKILEGIYTEKREWLKSVYLPHEKDPILDMHKLSAIICRSIIGNKPIIFDTSKALIMAKNQDKLLQNNQTLNDKDKQIKRIQWFVDNVYVNYKIAFDASIGIAYVDLFHLFQDNNQDDLKNKLEKIGTFIFYERSNCHENFRNSTILALMKNDLLNRKFDYLSYATIMFQLQQHTICKMTENKTDKL